MGFFSTPRRMRIWSKTRFIFFGLAILAFGLTEVGRFLYRPFIYRTGIDDFGLADCVGNLGGIIVQIFFGCAILNTEEKQSYRLAAFFSVGYVLYEFAQPYLPKGVFDWKDVYGTGVGFIISIIILTIIWHFNKESKLSVI